MWMQLGPELLGQAMQNIEGNYAAKMTGAGYKKKTNEAGSDLDAKKKRAEQLRKELGK
jgi:hypothetical protein